LIIDANIASLVFAAEPHDDFRPIWDALQNGRAVAVHGGHLTVEYMRLTRIRRLLLELGRRGALRKIEDDPVNLATNDFNERGIRSDDPHILGLAQVSTVRLLCSHDQDLHADFTNPSLLRPHGSVYQTSDHTPLIARHCRAKKQSRRRSRRSSR
jgi:hypothetical protein